MATIERLVGVYDADGTVLGELSYVLRRTFAGAHCSLCDITHGRVRERDDWRACRDALPVPFDTYHRDDRPPSTRGLRLPVVAAELAGGEVVALLGPAELEACAASPAALVEAVRREAAARGLVLPGS